ncbi:CHAP domain-containing protein [Kitasatospora sp. NPDC085464]|uniref:CHAP domain-containing protein n=1 Tax=Kitasatospora sp. NPDC085464 TaxID=3364063 RepID=UPI0037C8C113
MSMATMISQAEKSLGLSGRPNYITEDYASRNGQEFANAPWCDEGITYWARQSGEYSAVCFDTDYAYTVAHAVRFQQADQWHDGTDDVQRGDIVFFDWDGDLTIGSIDHIGLVTDTDDNGNVYTIEANTGNVVARRVRTAAVIVGYGRPQYSDQATTAPAPAPVGPAWPGEYLRQRSPMLHDDTVRTWQQQMANRGWRITVDGWYGPASASICRQFQQDSTDNGWPLTVDGIVGPATWTASWNRPVS